MDQKINTTEKEDQVELPKEVQKVILDIKLANQAKANKNAKMIAAGRGPSDAMMAEKIYDILEDLD